MLFLSLGKVFQRALGKESIYSGVHDELCSKKNVIKMQMDCSTTLDIYTNEFIYSTLGFSGPFSCVCIIFAISLAQCKQKLKIPNQKVEKHANSCNHFNQMW